MKILFQKKSETIIDRLICWWTRGPYFHCSVLFSDNTVLHGDNVLIEATRGFGVRTFILENYDPDHWDAIDVPMSDSEEAEVKEWAVKEIGCKYDWSGLIWSQVFRIPREHPDKWFCSEFAVAALQQAARLPGVKPCSVSPNGLARILKNR